MKILLAAANDASFVRRDARILRERHDVSEYVLPQHTWPSVRLLKLVRDHDLIVLWFATLRAVPLAMWASLLRRPLVLVVGGYEAVHLPEIGYGTARKRPDRHVTRWLLNRASRIVSVSATSQKSLRDNFRCDEKKLALVPHGFEDLAAGRPIEKRAEVLSAGNISRHLWLVKGQKGFFEAAAQMPDVSFVHAGSVDRKFLAEEIGDPPPNLRLLGRVAFEQMLELYASAKVYVQFSRHESFGCSVAEAMLFRCVPVVSDRFALPEVVGETGIIVGSNTRTELTAAIQKALSSPETEGERARQRILNEFSYEKRRDALLRVMGEAAGK